MSTPNARSFVSYSQTPPPFGPYTPIPGVAVTQLAANAAPQATQATTTGAETLWGWIANPVRVLKLVLGISLIGFALWQTFKDNPRVQQAVNVIIGASTGGAGAVATGAAQAQQAVAQQGGTNG